MDKREWGTLKEKHWLDRIGESLSHKTAHKVMLERYLVASKKRVRWGAINGTEAIRHAENLLASIN